MKSLPPGNYALSIAHPGHELRLHGFLEQAKPFVFLFTDNGDPKKINSMNNYLGSIYRDTSTIGGNENARNVLYTIEYKSKNKSLYLKDDEIISEINSGDISFFEFYIKKMANMFIFHKIEHVVMDSIEGFDIIHDICHVMTEIAVRLTEKVTGKKLSMYEFNIYFPVEYGMDENCVLIELDKEMRERKIRPIVQYHPSVFEELKQNLKIDFETANKFLQVENGYEGIRDLLLSINPDFFQYEALRPVINKKYSDDFNKYILPIKEKLEQSLKLS